jgi:DNA-binding response OmpR family regulator
MENLFVIGATNPDVDNLLKHFREKVKDVVKFDNLFEFRKKITTESPDAILVADNLKEKKIEDLLKSIKEQENCRDLPILALITSNDQKVSVRFLRNGACDAVYPPFLYEEVQTRLNLRFEEIKMRQSFTSGEFFFNEAQEKEQGRRSGIFRFFNHINAEVGNIVIHEGRVVHATYGSLIKADAFLQLASNSDLKFVFNDDHQIKNFSINEGITGLLLEASKLKDEIKKQEIDVSDEVKFLVIDENRIARVMASRILKSFNYVCKVTSPSEMTVRFMANYAPRFLIVDYGDSESMLDMLWPDGRREDDIPVIIYCDEDIKDINFTKLGKHEVNAVLYKSEFNKKIKSVLQANKLAQ